MSFDDSSFTGGYVRITQKMCLKHTRNTFDMSPRGEGPLTMQIRAQSGGEKSLKPKANGLQTARNFVGPL